MILLCWEIEGEKSISPSFPKAPLTATPHCTLLISQNGYLLRKLNINIMQYHWTMLHNIEISVGILLPAEILWISFEPPVTGSHFYHFRLLYHSHHRGLWYIVLIMINILYISCNFKIQINMVLFMSIVHLCNGRGCL